MREDLELLRGAVDIHLHAGPSVFPRLVDAVEAAEAARAAGMRGIAFKSHHAPTMDRAYLAEKAVPEVEAYGGVTLNYAAGGLNPFAVDAALRLGAKIVWMPSVDASNHRAHFGELGGYGSRLGYEKPRLYDEAEGITIFRGDGALDPRLGAILESIAEAGAAVATSHLSVEESKALVEEARRRGVERVVVTHVYFVTASLPVSDQRWMAERGALLELCYSSLSPAWRCASIDDVARAIREVGAEHYILSSDLGQVHNPLPPEGLRIYIRLLLERGIEPGDIRLMVKDNPERLLGLDEGP
ncbi:hypothetical protein AC482_02920 [miscellaneous Crenarchaeota group-15 archaeon DG-45]|uniref:Cytosolic protein n=1 Tax=miscellaneous Crenarchaeota group-15 archaeon DG-45 TaxID=1685127 RepID=A0A0M0BQF8_9ARCH|nr:MAG: hypothetical protein AC482_02920 [miscellaneous Crenarchaeota group-15 archaeon DG-45]